MSQPMIGLVTELALCRAVCAHPNDARPMPRSSPHRLDEQAEVERPHRHADRAGRAHDGDDYPAVEETALPGVGRTLLGAHLPNTVLKTLSDSSRGL